MPQVTGTTVVYDESNAPVSGAVIKSKLLEPPPYAGIYSDVEKEWTSGVDGVLEITDMFTGALYAIWGGLADRVRVFVPENLEEDDEFELPSLVYNDLTDPCA